MNNKNRTGFTVAALILIAGCVVAIGLVASAIRIHVPQLIEVFSESAHRVRIPGESDLHLSRTGAYAIYYVRYTGGKLMVDPPPALDCTLISAATGESVGLARDVAPSNFNILVGERELNTLIFSATVKSPGAHTLACQYMDGRAGPPVTVSVGPNYVWEVLHTGWNIARSVLGGLAMVCGSIVLGLFIVVLLLLQSRARARSAVAAA